MGAFKRSLCVASSNLSRLVVEVELDEAGELHVTGSCDRANGMESGGQIQDHIEHDAAAILKEPGGRRHLGEADTSALVDIWRRWHLNHMRAGCEHQRASWDTSKRIEFRTYSIDWDDRRQLERHAEADPFSHAVNLLALLKKAGVRAFAWEPLQGGPLMLPRLERVFEIVNEREAPEYRKQALRASQGLNWEWPIGKQRFEPKWTRNPAPAKPPLLLRIEHQAAGHVRHEQHPDGLLCKSCEVCGYKYGTAWRHEEIPAATLAELERITADREPPPPADAPFARLGFTLTSTPVDKRPDGPGNWHAEARHYRCTLTRGKVSMVLYFTKGPALDGPPDLAEVVECLRADAQIAQDEDNARELGLKPSQWAKLQKEAEQFTALCGDDAESLGVPS